MCEKRHPVLYLIIFCIVLSACNSAPKANEVSATPTIGTAQSPPATSPAATATTRPTSTVTLTPTLAPPAAVTDLHVYKKSCPWIEVGAPNKLHYAFQNLMVVKWTDVQGEDGYWLYRDGNRVAEIPADTQRYYDYFDVTKGGRTSVYYFITYNSAGQTKSALFPIANPC